MLDRHSLYCSRRAGNRPAGTPDWLGRLGLSKSLADRDVLAYLRPTLGQEDLLVYMIGRTEFLGVLQLIDYVS